MRAGESRRLGPVRQHPLVPLPLERLRELGRPRARDPARVERALRLARAAGEGDRRWRRRARPRVGPCRGSRGRPPPRSSGSGWIGLPWHESAEISSPRSVDRLERTGGAAAPSRSSSAGRQCALRAVEAISTASQPDGDRGVERLLERRSEIEREEEADLHAARISSRRTGRRSSVERAIAKIVREAADVVGDRRLRRDALGERAAELREHARPVDRRQHRQVDARAGSPCRANRTVPRSASSTPPGPRRARARADELPVAVPRRLDERLRPGAVVGDRRPVLEREQRADARVVPEGRVGRAPAPRVDLDDLRARDHAQHVDVVDRHVEEVGVRHPAPPVAARDAGPPQVAPAEIRMPRSAPSARPWTRSRRARDWRRKR